MFTVPLPGRILAIWLVGLAIAGLSLCAKADDVKPSLQCHLTFSVDGGNKFSDTPPQIAAPGQVYVKAEWTLDETRTVADNVIITSLRSEEGDFASANVGLKTWGAKPAWYQRIEKPYFNIQTEHTATYILDLRARPEGTTGTANQWDNSQQKYVNGPLPACDARKADVHNFLFHLNYRLYDGSPAPSLDLPFTVTITGAK